MAFRTLAATAFVFALLSAAQTAEAQDKLLPPPPPPPKLAEYAEPMDPGTQQQWRFLHSVAQAVIDLKANGERTMDAIENSEVTLTLDTMQDSSRVSVLCSNGDEDLNLFVQSLASELQLRGKVSEAVCSGAGRDDDPFVLKFHLHYESGGTSLFSEDPPELTFHVEKSREDEAGGYTGGQKETSPRLSR